MERDFFVGAVAGTLGISLLALSITNRESYFEMRTPSLLTKWVGRERARWIVGLAGTLMVALAVYVVATPLLVGNKASANGNSASRQTLR